MPDFAKNSQVCDANSMSFLVTDILTVPNKVDDHKFSEKILLAFCPF
jgi:hypothetical protein